MSSIVDENRHFFRYFAAYLVSISIFRFGSEIFENKKALVNQGLKLGDPRQIRTAVTAVKGRCPGPLDDRVIRTTLHIISEKIFFCKNFFMCRFFHLCQ